MKTQVMAKFLIPGDVILYERKNIRIISTKTKGETTRIAFERSNQTYIESCNSDEFLTVVNDGHHMR